MKTRGRWSKHWTRHVIAGAVAAISIACPLSQALAVPVPGGTLDPTTVPKYVTPLVIPPQMPASTTSPAPAANYDIAVRQFQQQILPGGVWNTLNGRTDPYGPTTVWSYGRAEDPLPDSTALGGGAGVAPAPNSTFNYPAFTVENTSAVTTTVRWINDLVDKTPGPTLGNFLPHLFAVDQTLHWANPTGTGCVQPTPTGTDCHTDNPAPYTGPVPLVTHVHGSHVTPESDGYPEAWWLPGANNIPVGYVNRGSVYTQFNNTNAVPGSAYYGYVNTQPAATLWYHDHALGMTRLNVYAGPAGFWLIRGGANGDAFVNDGTTPAPNDGVLPGPAPGLNVDGTPQDVNGLTPGSVRNQIREIPVAIQDRSFNYDPATGATSLFYPDTRAFFDGFTGPFISPTMMSDISPIWNPEVFFNTMVVNGSTWPRLDVAPARYRLRLLNGCNSRTLDLSMSVVTGPGPDTVNGTADDVLGAEIPFFQIGSEQGFLPQVAMIRTGFATLLPGNGTIPAIETPATDPTQALLMGPAERADVIVDFTGLANGTRIRIINTGPDSPFGHFVGNVPADPGTTGQVMEFVVSSALTLPADANTTPPQNLVLPAEVALGAASNTRQVSLNEVGSSQVCVSVDPITGVISGTIFSTTPGDPNFLANCAAAAPINLGEVPQPLMPRQALLGTVSSDPVSGNLTPIRKMWGDPITETPRLNSTEVWEIFNTTEDAHPIHLHLVRVQVVDRQAIDPLTLKPVVGTVTPPFPNETGYKDTVVSRPGQVTRIKATFDIAGLYVWHCHIVEHEDNEMMRPYTVVANSAPVFTGVPAITGTPTVGSVLSLINTGTSDPDMDPVTLTYQWRANGVAIAGATAATFTVTAAQRGAQITAAVTANDAYGGPTVITAPVTIQSFLDPTVTAFVHQLSGQVTVDGAVLVAGGEIAAYTPAGVLCGRTVVAAGIAAYGLTVYGDDPATPAVVEGAVAGEALTFRLWDNQRMKELPVRSLQLNGQRQTVTWNNGGIGTVNLQGLVQSHVGVYRVVAGGAVKWYLDADGNALWSALDLTIGNFGLATDTVVPGDWNGDGLTDLGTFRAGKWYVDSNGNGAWNATDRASSFGIAGDLPVSGDWNGDGVDEIGVFRGGKWYLDTDGNGFWNVTDAIASFGTVGDLPVAGDWNGDGISDLGVLRAGKWYLDSNGNRAWNAGDVIATFGTAGDLPVAGDWNGDGISDFAVMRNGVWYLDANVNRAWNTGDLILRNFGITGDQPYAGVWR